MTEKEETLMIGGGGQENSVTFEYRTGKQRPVL